VTCPTFGDYVFQLAADDGARTGTDTVTISAAYSNAGNTPPTVNIGNDISAIFHDTVEVAHTITDDGLPNPPAALALTWSVVSGPGQVRSFMATDRSKSWLRVTAPGTYTLRLTAHDGAVAVSDDLQLTIPELATKRLSWFWGTHSGSTIGMAGNLDPATYLYPQPVARNLVKALGSSTGTIALTGDGAVLTLGTNADGQLGDPAWASAGRKVLLPVPGLTGVVDIAQGGASRLAVKSDGTVWSWGANNSGQLGLGFASSNDTLTPSQIPGLSDVVEAEFGSTFAIARLGGGSVRTWGAGSNYRLGNNSTVNQPTPQDIGLANIVDIAAGQQFGLALSSDGTVKGWGLNSNGQLGNNSKTAAPVPIDVLNPAGTAPLTGIAAIAAGTSFSLALDSQGRVWAWGYGGSGQLGQGNLLDSLLPVQIPGLPSDIVSIAAASNTAFAVDSQGRVWGCGSNTGQILAEPNDVSWRMAMALVTGVPPVTAIFASQNNATAFALTPGNTYDGFLDANFSPSQQGDPFTSGEAADPDGDGIKNVVEYFLGTDPLVRNSGAPVTILPGLTPGSASFSFRGLAFADDLTVSPMESTDLIDWNPAAPETMTILDEGDIRMWTLEYSTGPRRFLRLEVTPR